MRIAVVVAESEVRKIDNHYTITIFCIVLDAPTEVPGDQGASKEVDVGDSGAVVGGTR